MCGVVWCSMKRMDGIPLRAEQKENFLQGCGDRILVLQAIPHAAHDTSKVVPPPTISACPSTAHAVPFLYYGFLCRTCGADCNPVPWAPHTLSRCLSISVPSQLDITSRHSKPPSTGERGMFPIIVLYLLFTVV